MTAVLDLRLFGGLYIAQAGQAVSGFLSGKSPALLAYLAVTARPHPRDGLAALLWGELPETDARNNLRQALANLRKLLAPYLIINRESVAFDCDAPHTLDSADFERLLRESRIEGERQYEHLAAAAALYQGDFLAGFYVRDAPEFEEWMLAQRARYRELALHALHQLAEHHLQRGEYGRAIDAATRLLALDAWREEAHRQLMLALARSGRQRAALVQYDKCRQLLLDELGVEPAAETTALFERIRSARREVRLPQPDTPFVGREVELAAIDRLLADPTARLITLSGPGGSGKSRLALEAAGRAAGRYLHGAYFASLAAAGSVEAIPGAIAEVLGLALSGRTSAAAQLMEYLRDKELLLLLDNLEHLPQADDLLGRLVQACPEVKLLVTSRGRLNLHGERLVELEGLDTPPAGNAPNISDYAAVQLFLNSARGVQPAFTLEAGSANGGQMTVAHHVAHDVAHHVAHDVAHHVAHDVAHHVGVICRLVGGLPLAIELAAAWVRHMSCAEIAAELGHNLDLLSTTQRNVPDRHRSLRAAFDHSWALLSEDEQRCFARLALFRGGCDRPAALAVTGARPPVLAALCDQSLLRRDAGGRYAMHELLRQFAQHKLEADPPAYAAAERRHIDYYLAYLAAREEALLDARQQDARREIAAEMDNIRAAWQRAIERAQPDWLGPGLESLRLHLEQAGIFGEAADMFAAAALVEEAVSSGVGALLARLLSRQAWFDQRLNHHQQAQTMVGRALQILAGAQPRLPAEEALCHSCLGNISRAVGDFAQSAASFQESVVLYRLAGRPGDVAAALNGLAAAQSELGNFDEARRLHEESLAIKRELGDRRGMGVSLLNLGVMALAEADNETARLLEEEALQIFREIDYPLAVAIALNNLGAALANLGENEPARAALLEGLEVNREVGNLHLQLHFLGNLGSVAGALGDLRESWRLTRQALQLGQQIGSTSGTIYGLFCAALFLSRQGNRERAVELATLVLLHTSTNRENVGRAKRLLVELAGILPAADMAAAVQRGKQLELAEAVAALLAAEDPVGGKRQLRGF